MSGYTRWVLHGQHYVCRLWCGYLCVVHPATSVAPTKPAPEGVEIGGVKREEIREDISVGDGLRDGAMDEVISKTLR